AEPGASLLDAARKADVPIRNECGGQGVCGRCLVEIRRGEVRRLPTRHAPPEGLDLACRTQLTEGDVEVFVPEDSREVDTEVTVRPVEPFPAEFPPPGGMIERVGLQLTPPSLDDNRADAERLVRALTRWRESHYSLGIEVLRNLPRHLREADWNPAATLAVEPWGHKVLDVRSSDEAARCMAAVDVGTTAVKARLLAPGAGREASCYNSQVMFGPDVISRIIHCQRDPERGCPNLQRCVAADINRLLAALLEAEGRSAEDVWGLVVSGNTTMVHLLLGLYPVWIRREPYVGCAYMLPSVNAPEVGVEINPAGQVFCLPSVSSFVGADIAAGVLATGLADREEPAALIDLGTNGEMVVGCREFMVCCSASAGPAFEGGASASGTRARAGAIDSVWFDESVQWRTIGGEPPLGICGTGYIGLLATLVREGIIDKTGAFVPGAAGVREPHEGAAEYVLVPAEKAAREHDIVLTQADVENLVRAKGAIYAAGSILLGSLGMEWTDLERIMLAGGFGESLDKDDAVAIGLLPDVDREAIEFVGNTSLKGAVLAAQSAESYWKAREIAGNMTYFELSTHPDFMDQFVSACFLPHTDTEKFPSVSSTERSAKEDQKAGTQ
ncbi:MAG: ASKHA domain-containing protein, partial [Candidatus Brocadiaceae bacterium]